MLKDAAVDSIIWLLSLSFDTSKKTCCQSKLSEFGSYQEVYSLFLFPLVSSSFRNTDVAFFPILIGNYINPVKRTTVIRH